MEVSYYEYGEKTELSREYFESGKIRKTAYYKNGYPDGITTHYYENGLTASKGVFKEGVIEGAWKSYHINGNLHEVLNYKDGKLNGNTEVFFSINAKNFTGSYEDDLKKGLFSYYTPMGNCSYGVIYDYDTILSVMNTCK